MSATAPAVERAPILEVEKLGKRFGGLVALTDVSFAIREGEIYGLIGPNGAGKTTLFNLLTGIYRADEGTMRFGGAPLRNTTPDKIAKLGIARTFQNIRLFKDLTVLANVKIGGHIHYKYAATSAVLHTNRFSATEAAAEEEALKLLEIFGLRDRAREYAKNLPYGDQRRLEIARALAARPRLLLLDEPAAGLNDRETLDLMETIHGIRDRFDIAILLIEHNMELVMGICERILVLNFGKVIAQGTPAEVRANPTVVEAYLGDPQAAHA